MFLTYGRNSGGDLTHISEAKRGVDCGLFCPFCSVPLIARKGDVIGHHFGHYGPTCRPSAAAAELIPSFEGYFIYGLTPAQREALTTLIDRAEPGFSAVDKRIVRQPTLNALAQKTSSVSSMPRIVPTGSGRFTG